MEQQLVELRSALLTEVAALQADPKRTAEWEQRLGSVRALAEVMNTIVHTSVGGHLATRLLSTNDKAKE